MSTHIRLSRASAETAHAELSVAIHSTKRMLAAVTDPHDKAFYEDLLLKITPARDELLQQLCPPNYGKKAAA